MMQENFLAYCWKHRLLRESGLRTCTGESIEILDPGQPNLDAGPDFLTARIRINRMIWVGNVEIHVLSSDWKKHGHQQDEAYDHVILHVVYTQDGPCLNSKGRVIPQLEVSRVIRKVFTAKNPQPERFAGIKPCLNLQHGKDQSGTRAWLQRLLSERMNRKTGVMLHYLKFFGWDWEQLFHFMLAGSLGLKANVLAFGLLAQSAPVSLLRKYSDRQIRIEALLFGQAGMLECSFRDPYPTALKKEYRYLMKKRMLRPMKASLWRFFRLRPPSFPTIRIAQLSAMAAKPDLSFRAAMEASCMQDLRHLLRVSASSYWDTHYRFDQVSGLKQKVTGDELLDRITINTIVPLTMLYGRQTGKTRLSGGAMQLLHQLPPERHFRMKSLSGAGFSAENAAETQALLEWADAYCAGEKCLYCMYGLKEREFNQFRMRAESSPSGGYLPDGCGDLPVG